MTDPAQHDPYAQQPGYTAQPSYGGQPAPGPGGAGGRYVPPSLDEVWYKTTTNILLTIVTCGIWSLAWSYRTHDDLQKHNGEGIGGVLALVIGLVFFIALGFTVPMELEKAYNRNGWPSPVKATDGLWLLIPLVGGFIWYPKMQAALNSYWVSQGSQPAPAS
jgi:hypothetical protein